jgi:hypothetical protein
MKIFFTERTVVPAPVASQGLLCRPPKAAAGPVKRSALLPDITSMMTPTQLVAPLAIA